MARARDSTVLLNVCTFLLLMGLCNCTLDSTLCAILNQPIELYVFRTAPPNPNASIAFVYPPGTNGTAPAGVPVILVADNPIRRTQSPQSELLGYQRAIRIGGLRADDATRTQATSVLDLQTTELNGTITYAGIRTTSTIPAVEELAVTGGTEKFRGASGYIKSSLVSTSGGITIVKFVLYLCN